MSSSYYFLAGTNPASSRERIAHPVGTTVRVSDFLKHLPVRRKASLKLSTKILSNIKRLLQAYAMARPSIRLSPKVLGGKSDGDWVYPAKQGASIMDAVLKIAGAEVASECMTKVAEVPDSDELGDSAEALQNSHDTGVRFMRIVAAVPKADGFTCSSSKNEVVGILTMWKDLAKACRCGQYVSVNGRPLSTGKGIAKSFVKLYKSYIRSMVRDGQAQPNVVDPFLCVQISLSRGSYDANVEPGKDDILLDHDTYVLSAVENIFKEIYGSHTGNTTDDPVNQPETNGRATSSCSGYQSTTAHSISTDLTVECDERRGSRLDNTAMAISPPTLCVASNQSTTSNDCLRVDSKPGQTTRAVNANPDRGSKTQRTWMRLDKPTGMSDNPLPSGSTSQLPTPVESPINPIGAEHCRFVQSTIDRSNGSPVKPARPPSSSLNRAS